MAIQGYLNWPDGDTTFATPVYLNTIPAVNDYPNGQVTFDLVSDGNAYWKNNNSSNAISVDLYLCDQYGNNRVYLMTVSLGKGGTSTTIKSATITNGQALMGTPIHIIGVGEYVNSLMLRRYTTITINTATATHSVGVYSATGGSGSVNKTSAAAGETVTYTASPSTGYAADAPTSGGITFTAAGANKWTFTMPDRDVNILPHFSKINYTLSRVASPNTGGTVTLSKNTAQIGDEITITATPATGYRVKSISTNPSRTITNNKFTMPAGNVTVTVVFEKISYTVSKTVTPAAGGTASINKTSATMGEEITVTATPATGYRLKSITTSPAQTVTNNKFTMPASAVTVTVTFEKINYTITKNSNPAAGGTVTTNKTTANYGDTVTVSQTPATGYYFDGWTKTPNDLAINNGAFTMPAQNVTLIANYLKRSTASVNTKNLTSNGTVRLTITPDKAEYRHKYRLNFGTGMDTGWVTVAANTTVIDIPVPDSWADAIPNADSKSGGTLTVKTYKSNNTTEIGSYELTGFTYNVRAGIVPTLTDITTDIIRTINGTTYADIGDLYVQNKSGVRIRATAAGARSSTITKIESTLSGYTGNAYNKTLNNTTSLDYTTGLLSVKGTITITVKATDSRGRTVTKTKTITVTAYSKPSGTLNAWRVDSGGETDNFGAYAKYSKTNSYTQIGNNSLSVTLKSQNVQVTNPANSGNLLPTSRQTFDRLTEYNIQLILQDAFETVTINKKLPTALFVFHVNQDGDRLAFMKAINSGLSKNNKDSVIEFSEDAQIYIGTKLLEKYLSQNYDVVQLGPGDDCNNLTKGMYYITYNVANSPDNWGILEVVTINSDIYQFMFKRQGLYYRDYSGSPLSWSDWYKIRGTTQTERTLQTISLGTNSYLWYYKVGSTVTVNVQYDVVNGTISAWSSKVIGTLPAGFRPNVYVRAYGVMDRTGDVGGYIGVRDNGEVFIGTRYNAFSATGGVIQATITFAAE